MRSLPNGRGNGPSNSTSSACSTPSGNVTITARACSTRLRANTRTLAGSHSIRFTGRLSRMSRLRRLQRAVEQGGIAFVDVEVLLVAGDIGLQPPFQRERCRLHRMIVLDELLKITASDFRARQNL